MTKAERNYIWRAKRRAKRQQDQVGLLAWIEAEFKQLYERIAELEKAPATKAPARRKRPQS